jgi:hypothetical protein
MLRFATETSYIGVALAAKAARTVTPFVNQRWGIAIFFTTAEPKPPLPIAELARLFGLTMAEARVAASIADGICPLARSRHGTG